MKLPSQPPLLHSSAFDFSVKCSSSASGVVFGSGASAPGKPLPSVPMTPALVPWRPSAAAIHWLHEVLPLVPVTPQTQSASEGRP